jgi:hypothetical protein
MIPFGEFPNCSVAVDYCKRPVLTGSRRIERVTTVSIETMSLIATLPEDIEFVGPNTGTVMPAETQDEADLVD